MPKNRSIFGNQIELLYTDIADTPNGLKIIEINAVNSSARYAYDIEKLIIAINKM